LEPSVELPVEDEEEFVGRRPGHDRARRDVAFGVIAPERVGAGEKGAEPRNRLVVTGLGAAVGGERPQKSLAPRAAHPAGL
jgi:hypothetical protein